LPWSRGSSIRAIGRSLRNACRARWTGAAAAGRSATVAPVRRHWRNIVGSVRARRIRLRAGRRPGDQSKADGLGGFLEEGEDILVSHAVEERGVAGGGLAVGGLAGAVAVRRGDGGEQAEHDVATDLLVVGAEELAGDDERLGGDLEEVVAEGSAEVGDEDVAVNAGEQLQFVGGVAGGEGGGDEGPGGAVGAEEGHADGEPGVGRGRWWGAEGDHGLGPGNRRPCGRPYISLIRRRGGPGQGE
jgi:hypothetical protein